MSELLNIIATYNPQELQEKYEAANDKASQIKEEFDDEIDAVRYKYDKDYQAVINERKLYLAAIAIARKYGTGEKITKWMQKHEDMGLMLSSVSKDGQEIWIRK